MRMTFSSSAFRFFKSATEAMVVVQSTNKQACAGLSTYIQTTS
jgi:hypothetical protein